MGNFKLTLKSGKAVIVTEESQEAAMRWYKREINSEAEIVKCEWVKSEPWTMSVGFGGEA